MELLSGINIVHTRGLNSARAAAACRSVRDANLQVSLRLQVGQSLIMGKGKERLSGLEARVSPLSRPCRSLQVNQILRSSNARRDIRALAAPLMLRHFNRF